MSLWRLYYHFVWATKGRLPLISPEREPIVDQYIRGKAKSFEAIVHAVGGTDNHLHLLVSVPPTIAPAVFIRAIKGGSAHWITHGPTGTSDPFGWQAGYGVFSLSQRQLPRAVEYVQGQKQHHAQGTLIPALERVSDSDTPLVGEAPPQDGQ